MWGAAGWWGGALAAAALLLALGARARARARAHRKSVKTHALVSYLIQEYIL